MKNTEESPTETGRHDGGNVPLFCFSVGKRVAERKKKSTMTNLAFAVDLLFLSHVEILFPLHFEFHADAFTSSCSTSM